MKDDASYNITSILEFSMTELKKNNKNAYEIIISNSKDGFFDNHQTAGSLKGFAKEILEASYKPME